MKIEIPCHENFKRMTPSNDGRYCASCEKVVVDFTKMNTGAIKDYFRNNVSSEVCGRFKSSQVGEGTKLGRFVWNLKERIQTRAGFMPVRVIFVGVLTSLSAFMSSCMGKVVENYPNEDQKPGNTKTEKVNTEQKSDTIKETQKR